MYSIAIDKADGTVLAGLAEARNAVRGTGITVVEADGVSGKWLAELPEHLADQLNGVGYFEVNCGGYQIFAEA